MTEHIDGPTEVDLDVEAPATVQLIVDVPWYTAGTEHHELRIAINDFGYIAHCPCGWNKYFESAGTNIYDAYREHLT